MELALYHPDHGYYQTNDQSIGKAGDFFTSVSVGKVFGELLAFQFAEWLEAFDANELAEGSSPSSSSLVPRPRPRKGDSKSKSRTRTRDEDEDDRAPLQLVEAGAHDGRLAADILTWLRLHRAELFEQIDYWIIEPSIARQRWQQNTLKEFAPRVRWLRGLPGSSSSFSLSPNTLKRELQPFSGVRGVIFSNELLDAMPVHRLGWDTKRQRWFEWGVGWEAHRVQQLTLALHATAAQRLAWLEEVITLAHRVGALPKPRA